MSNQPQPTISYVDHIVKSALESVSKGYAVFLLARGAKLPAKGTTGTWAERASMDEALIRAWFAADPEANYGIALTETDLLIDCDPKHYPRAEPEEPADRTIRSYDIEKVPVTNHDVARDLFEYCPYLQQTRLVLTPSDGWHIYLKKPADYWPARHSDKWPGIEIFSKGHLVVGPGSRGSRGHSYKLYKDVMPLEVKI